MTRLMLSRLPCRFSTSRYSPKEQVYQISAKFNHFWALQVAPKFYVHTQENRQTLSDSSSTEIENSSGSTVKPNFFFLFSTLYHKTCSFKK